MSNTIIEDLERLRVEYDKTIGVNRSTEHIDSFVKSKIVAKLRLQGNIITEIEEYHLPWITALICNSGSSFISDKGLLYMRIRSLYCQDNSEIFNKALHVEINEFKDTILPYADRYCIQRMIEHRNSLSNSADQDSESLTACIDAIKKYENKIKKNQKKLKKEQEELNGILKENEKKEEIIPESDETPGEDVTVEKNDPLGTDESQITDEAKGENDVKDSTDNDEVDKRKKSIEKIEHSIDEDAKKLAAQLKKQEELQQIVDSKYAEIDRLDPYVELLVQRNEIYDSIIIQKRSECYEKIRTGGLKTEIELLDSLFYPTEETPDYSQYKISIDNLFRALKNEKYRSQEIRAIVKLTQIGLLNIEDDRLIHYLGDNKQLLNEYLVDHMKDNIMDIINDRDFCKLFDVAIAHEIEATTVIYGALWDSIEDIGIWKYIYEHIGNECIFAKFVSEIRGRVLRSILEFLDTYQINMPSFVQSLSKQKEVNSDLIFRIVQNYDKKLSKSNRDLRRANRRMDIQEGSNVSKVFSAMYEPMEKLEMLTYDVKVYDGSIKKRVIANQMVECVSKFRKGLEELEIFPAESFENWKTQKILSYDREKHRYEDGNVKDSDQVVVKTLGFKYITAEMDNDESDEHIEYAKVMPVKG